MAAVHLNSTPVITGYHYSVPTCNHTALLSAWIL